MIKLTELKKMIKANSHRPAFYSEGLKNVIFNYNSRVIIEIKQCDQLKLFNHLKSINYVDNDYKFDDFYLDLELKNKLEKIIGNKWDHNLLLVNTGIQFYKYTEWSYDQKIPYQVFKTEKGLMKIKSEYIGFLDQNVKTGCVLKTNDTQSMCFIYNNTNDCIGVCMVEKFDMDELTEYTKW